MNNSAFLFLRLRAVPAAIALVCCTTLVACGGGNDDSGGGGDGDTGGGGGGNTTLPAMSAQGVVVVDQAVSKATVCADLNANGECDANEPSSVATGADGRYSIAYQPADAVGQAAFEKAPRLAMVSTDSVDAATPSETFTSKAYTLSAPAELGAQINPLTTLVQRSVASGLALAEAESAVAQQLGITVGEIRDYQGNASSETGVLPDNARTFARLTAYALELGATLAIIPSSVAGTPSTSLGSLSYTDARNHAFRERSSDGVVGADGTVAQFESRTTVSAGTAVEKAALYPVNLTAEGWKLCDDKTPRVSTRGTPNRTTVCAGSGKFAGFATQRLDVGGKPMAEVLATVRAGDSTLSSHGLRHDLAIDVDPALLASASFPAGSELTTNLSAQLVDSAPFINNPVSDVHGFDTLKALVAARPASAVVLPSGRGSHGGLGLIDANHIMRVAFISETKAQFYACESVAPYATYGACREHSVSDYQIDTVHGVPLLRFAASPGQDYMGHQRGFTEMNGSVYVYRQPRARTSDDAAMSYSQRLNGVAWTALKTALSLN